ncbi:MULTISPECIES: hypothetical protein [unclassified Streptomyces]|uniref:hypothetical protein n=1 Tax=unclassified Streptomyces TaxID=2593676 RepID=UPI0013A70A13|nr:MULTISPECIES: hypothetical protein [unclassified Streptomyces]
MSFVIFGLLILAGCVAIAYFRPREERAGCLLVSGSLFLLCAFLTAWFLIAANTA